MPSIYQLGFDVAEEHTQSSASRVGFVQPGAEEHSQVTFAKLRQLRIHTQELRSLFFDADQRTSMSTINATEFQEICDRVWRDRVAVLKGGNKLGGEAALVQAVYWRLRKAGINAKGRVDTSGSTPALFAYQSVVLQILNASAHPPFDGASILSTLLDRYQNEGGKAKG